MAEEAAAVAKPAAANWQGVAKTLRAYYGARRERLGQNVNLRQAAALRTVPFLLNVNRDGLPGFKDSNLMPFGVTGLEPDDMVTALWKDIFTNIRLVTEAERPAIEMVGMTGDSGTFGQGAETRFEYWAIAHDGVADRSMTMLQWKCQQVADWLQKSFRLEAVIHCCRASEFREGKLEALENDPIQAKALPVIRDRFYASLFPLAGKIPLLHLAPMQNVPYEKVVEKWQAGQWGNPDQVVDLGGLTAPTPVHLIHDVLHCLKSSGKRLSDNVFSLALSLVRLRHGSKVLQTDMVKRTFMKEPSAADPFEVSFDLIEAGLKDATKEGRFYLQQVYYLKLDPGLSKLGDGKEPPPGSGKARAAKRVKAWGWSHMVVMSLDNITMWNYQQLLTFYRMLVGFVSFAQEELLAAARKHAESGAAGEEAAALTETVSKEVKTFFRVSPGKIMPVQPFTDSYYQTTEFRITQTPGLPRSSTWAISLETPIGRRMDATRAELVMMEKCSLLKQMLWLTQTGILKNTSKAKGKAGEAEIPRPWIRELIEACCNLNDAPAGLSQKEINAKLGRRDAIHFLLGANVCKSMEPKPKSRAKDGPSASSIGIMGDAAVFDFEGEGHSVLDDVTLAYINGAGEIYAHTMAFSHDGLARAFQLMLPSINYNEQKEKINVEFVVPPGTEGRKIKEAFFKTLAEMATFFHEEREFPRRYLTRHRGVPYVYEKPATSSEISMTGCKTVPEMLNVLENTGGTRYEVMVGSTVGGFERMRDLYAQAYPGALNLYFLRDNEPNQFHLIDETGAFSSESFAGRGRSAFIGDTVEFLKRYAERKDLQMHLFDIKKGRGRIVNFQVTEADIPPELLNQRSSKFTLSFFNSPDNDPDKVIMNLAGQQGAPVAMTAEVLVKLKTMVKKMGNILLLDLPDVFPLPGGQSIPMTNAAVALKASKRLRAMLLS